MKDDASGATGGGGLRRRRERRGPRGRFPSETAAEALEERVLPAVNLIVDYSLDNGFFDDATRRAAIEEVASEIGHRLDDYLAAKGPAAYTIKDPRTGADLTRTFSVPSRAIRLFVSGAALSRGRLAQTHLSDSMLRFNRDSAGVADYAPFAGSIGFDSDTSTAWSFDGTPDNLRAERDFKAVARHQIFQVLGVNTQSLGWKRINGGRAYLSGANALLTATYSDLVREPREADWRALEGIGWELAEDDTIDTAVLQLGYEFGTNVNGELESPTDVVFYRIDAQAGAVFRMSLPSGGVSPDFRMWSSDGNEIYYDYDGGQQYPYGFTFDQSGTYYLAISDDRLDYDLRSRAGRSNPFGSFGSFGFGYSLLHGDVVGSGIEGDQYGNFPTDAHVLVGGGAYRTAQPLDWNFDSDLYKFSAGAGTTVTIRTSRPPGASAAADTYIRLFDAAGRELAHSDSGGGDGYASLQYTFTAAGTYYVGISSTLNKNYDPIDGPSGGAGDVTGQYLLEVALGTAAQALEGTKNQAEVPDLIGRTTTGSWWVTSNADPSVLDRSYGVHAASGSWRDVLTGDFNGDRLVDVAGRTSGGVWQVGRNADGRFDFTGPAIGFWGEAAGWANVLALDVNADGITDIVGRAVSTGQWFGFVSRRAAGGAVSHERLLLKNWSKADWQDARVARNIFGDGRDAVVARHPAGGWYGLQFSGATPTATTRTVFGGWGGAAGWRDIQIADFDGDGRDDIAGRTAAGHWYVSRNAAGGAATGFWGFWNERADWRDVMVGDFAGDDRPDVVGRAADGTWYVSAGTGTTFAAPKLFGRWNPNLVWVDVMAADFVGNEKADIAGRTAAAGAHYWYVGASDGAAMAPVKYFGKWAGHVTWQAARASTNLSSGQFAAAGLGSALPSLLAPVSYPALKSVAAAAGTSPAIASSLSSASVAKSPPPALSSPALASPASVTPPPSAAPSPVAVAPTPALAPGAVGTAAPSGSFGRSGSAARRFDPGPLSPVPRSPLDAELVSDLFADSGLLDGLLAS